MKQAEGADGSNHHRGRRGLQGPQGTQNAADETETATDFVFNRLPEKQYFILYTIKCV